MRNNHKLQTAIIFLTLIILLSACSGTKEPATIKVAIRPFISNAPFFIAQEEGFFEEQGLTIEYVAIERSSEAIPAIEQGDLDVVAGSPSAGIFNAIARGANIKLVAGKGQIASSGCSFTALMASNPFLESHPSKSPADLKGARIGLNPTSWNAYFTELYLNQANLSLDDIEVFQGGDTEQFEGLQNGSLDIMTALEPMVTRVLQAGAGSIWLSVNDIIPGFSYSQLWYGPTFLKDNPELGKRFMLAYLKGVRQYNLGKTDRNIEILTKYTELEKELVREACWVTISNDAKISIPDIMDFQEWVLEKGLLDEIVSQEKFWDPSFLDFANNELESNK
jgi:NitT/TauT family transport system substrate-binding protein